MFFFICAITIVIILSTVNNNLFQIYQLLGYIKIFTKVSTNMSLFIFYYFKLKKICILKNNIVYLCCKMLK